jgi:hypothetical protein
VDCHQRTHRAVALDQTGRMLGDAEFPATARGYRLVESPEPIDRPGRCEIQRLHAPGVAATFDLRRSDRNRSRVLFLTSAPFAPAGSPATVVLEQLDRATGTVLSGALAVPSAPAFAAEP